MESLCNWIGNSTLAGTKHGRKKHMSGFDRNASNIWVLFVG